MITFFDEDNILILHYYSEYQEVDWIDERLRERESISLKNVFTVRREDLITKTDTHDSTRSPVDTFGDTDEDNYRDFRIGSLDGEYWRIRADVLGLNNDLLIAHSITLTVGMFVAERNISIFRRIEQVADEQVIIGGSREGAIPEDDFRTLIRDFPTSTECRLYADARVARVVQEYYSKASEAEIRLQRHLDRKRSPRRRARSRPDQISLLELDKFTFVHDSFVKMLGDADSYSEHCWQKKVARLFCLIFPQYICVLESVRITERFSHPGENVRREIDMVLVDSSGAIDILEIKKPFADCLVSRGRYRDNYVPKRELAGAVVQCEKYLFYLNCGGAISEKAVQERLDEKLPNAPQIRIINPRAYILAGRDDNLTDEQKFDFEFTRRGSKGVVDMITYDDLLRRLNTMTEALRMRISNVRDNSSQTDGAVS
ncbi:Shedu immune nuclease family protein [Actinomyces procaprae]|uniref:Shedu immune nuclease family protein n=1 Tax=Actinomyces procaprae TaxID=2560010 RepID=UPI00109DA5F8|nr:Shedu immune nuclease family protein [Actinomyces procaprae]